MKRTLTGIAAASMVLGTIAPMAFAATTSMQWQSNTLSINGKAAISNVPSTVSGNTTYISVYDMQQYLTMLGYKATWNYNTMNITVSGNPDTSSLPQVGGNAMIQVNGTTVMKLNHIVAQPKGWTTPSSFVPIYDFQLLLNALGINQQWDGATHTWSAKTAPVAGTLAITGAPSSAIPTNTHEMLGLTNNGTAEMSGVTWSVSGTGAVVSNSGVFEASQAGSYTVTATYLGKSTSATITVYGAAGNVKLAATGMVADGQSTGSVTATVVDKNGNTVTNYNGTVNAYVESSDPNVSLMQGGKTVKSSLAAPVSYNVTNGVVTIPVQSGTNAGSNVNVFVQLPNGTWQMASITEATPVATSLKFDNTNTMLNSQVENEQSIAGGYVYSATPGAVAPTVSILDQAGKPIPVSDLSSATPTFYLTVTGQGVDGNEVEYDGVASTELVYADTTGATTATNLPLYNSGSNDKVRIIALHPDSVGPVTLSANDPNLADTNAMETLTAYQQGGYSALSATNANSGSSYSADVVGNGTAANDPTYNVTAVDSNGNWTTGTSSAPDPTSLTATVTGPDGKTSAAFTATPTISNGMGTVTVTAGSGASITAGTYTVTIADSATNPTSTVKETFTVTPGAVAKLVLTPASSANDVNLLASNPVGAVGVQLEDQYGNVVHQGGVVLNVSAGGSAKTPYQEVATNAAGQANLSIALPANTTIDTGYLTVGLNSTWATNNPSEVNSSDVSTLETGVSSATFDESNYVTSRLTAQSAKASYTAGSVPWVTAYAFDSNGSPIPDKLSYTVTMPNGTTTSAASATAGAKFNPLGGTTTATMAGTYTVNITDTQAVGNPTTSVSFTVTPAAATGAGVFINGMNVAKDSTDMTTANQVTPIKVSLVDKYGNATTSGSSQTVNLSNSGKGGVFEVNGQVVTSVTIPANSMGVTVDYLNTASVAYDDLTATLPPAAPAAAQLQSASIATGTSATTLTLTYNAALQASTTVSASQYQVMVNGAVDTVTGVKVTGDTVVLTLGSAVSAGQNVTVSYTAGATPVVDANNNDVANFSNQYVSVQ